MAPCAHTTTQVLNPSQMLKVLYGLALANLLRSFFSTSPSVVCDPATGDCFCLVFCPSALAQAIAHPWSTAFFPHPFHPLPLSCPSPLDGFGGPAFFASCPSFINEHYDALL